MRAEPTPGSSAARAATRRAGSSAAPCATRCSARGRPDLAVAGDARPRRALRGRRRAGVPALRGVRRLARDRPRRRTRLRPVAAAGRRRSRTDLAQRDFTVNAMAPCRCGGGELIDPLGGRADLEAGILRLVGAGGLRARPAAPAAAGRASPPSSASRPTRETERRHARAAPRVTEAAGERVFAELRRSCRRPRRSTGSSWPTGSGVLPRCCPSSTALHGVEQSHFHHLDVYDHTLEVLRQLSSSSGAWPSSSATSPPALRARARRAAGRRADARRRRCASARCCTTSASPPRAACAPTAASPSSGHDALGERDGRRALPPAAHQRALRALPRRRSPATTSCSASWCTSARSPRARLPLPAPHARRWRSRSRCSSCADRLATRGPQRRARRSRRTWSWRAS